ncbi:MAG: A/G-specific adenine glycosylase [Cytophagales bacterium]|nr:A/G-specific adenine glycosylase [Cytophagales bacterium]
MKSGFFSSKIVEWYADHHRDLPWRKTRDPYKIWLSEIILQQTRVLQGLPYYREFVRRYPTVRALAAAREQDILRSWQGLGYYSRARNLRKCAQAITSRPGAKFPETASELRTLPGIGTYTSAAIASLAFDEKIAVVDGNVFRVLGRLFGIDDDISTNRGRKIFETLANQLMPTTNPGTHNQAVMEFGALHCLPVNPKCSSCIFETGCYAARHGMQDQLPVKSKSKKPSRRYFYYMVIRRGKKLMMRKRVERDIWTGLFDFPLFETKKPIATSRIAALVGLRSSPNARIQVKISKEFKHILSHQIIRARFLEMPAKQKDELRVEIIADARYYSPAEVRRLPKPVLISRYLETTGFL